MQNLQYINNIFNYYNENLFNKSLPEVIITISRDSKMSGMFSADQWKKKDGKSLHELTLNPDYIDPYDIEFHQTLVHEMCHLEQFISGTPGKSGYHNLEFSQLMKRVGLQTSDTGMPEGFKTGRRMYDYVIEGGLFQKAFQKLQETGFEAVEVIPVKKQKLIKSRFSGKRSKYNCSCGTNVWGRTGLNIFCPNCNQSYKEN